ncbi:MAG TPA: hypothetical protein VLB79_09230 [Solirubrobacterales bacterium]|nr:hypothetical protein [Solirubrobacterales bacterium]
MANPRAEAEDKLGGDYEARVLEPSPPAVGPPGYSDDPVAPGEVPEGRDLVSPVHNRGDLTWEEIVEQEPDLGPWCAERWLAAWKRLEPLPASFARTRDALHKVAVAVVAPARKPENEISLRYTRGGFGTPFFDDDGTECQVRVEGGELIRQRGTEETPEPLPVEVDPAATRALGDLYGFACSVLEQLRADEADADSSLVRLWPEHFDMAMELGDEGRGTRANFGASPGDENHEEPYLYVGPWDAGRASGELWNATGFSGAELGYSELLAAGDQRRAALDFMRERYRAIRVG